MDNNDRLDKIEERLASIEGILEKANLMIETIVNEVKPTIDSLTNNPMIKALGFGGKKK